MVRLSKNIAVAFAILQLVQLPAHSAKRPPRGLLDKVLRRLPPPVQRWLTRGTVPVQGAGKRAYLKIDDVPYDEREKHRATIRTAKELVALGVTAENFRHWPPPTTKIGQIYEAYRAVTAAKWTKEPDRPPVRVGRKTSTRTYRRRIKEALTRREPVWVTSPRQLQRRRFLARLGEKVTQGSVVLSTLDNVGLVKTAVERATNLRCYLVASDGNIPYAFTPRLPENLSPEVLALASRLRPGFGPAAIVLDMGPRASGFNVPEGNRPKVEYQKIVCGILGLE